MLAFIMTYWDEMLIAISGIISGASALAAITPTEKDDFILSKIRKGLDVLALNIGHAKPAVAG